MRNQNFSKAGLLSVIVPVYNVEQYLDRCVESIVNQTYTNLEIILVDDGSPDRCPEMCDAWAERESRIKVIHKENGGLSDARNAGIAAATGRYLAFVDSDDYVDSCMYETMLEAMNRTDSGIASCGRYIVKGTEQIAMHSMDRETLFAAEDAIKELLIGGCVEEAACDKVYRAELFAGICFPVGEINEDIVIMPMLLSRAEKIVHVGSAFYYYWQNSSSITRSAYTPKKKVVLDHLDALESYLADVQPTLLPYFDVLQSRYCQSMLYLLLDNRTVYRQYSKDRQAFYDRFQRSFLPSLKLGRANRTERLKGLLIYFHLYYVLHAIKKGNI